MEDIFVSCEFLKRGDASCHSLPRILSKIPRAVGFSESQNSNQIGG
jgi:hypothetical protein